MAATLDTRTEAEMKATEIMWKTCWDGAFVGLPKEVTRKLYGLLIKRADSYLDLIAAHHPDESVRERVKERDR